MSTVVLRVDADASIGFGHLERTMALARELATINYRPVFVTREEGLAASRLRACGFTDVETFEGPEAEGDAILAPGPGIVLFDIGSTTHARVAEVKALGGFVATFEDLGDGRYLADLVIDANLVEATNPKKMETPTRYLLGPDYAILAPAVVAARRRRRKPGPVRRILVSCGGSDPAGVTVGVVRGLATYDSEVEVELVLGPGFAHARALNAALLEASRTFTITEAPTDLPDRLRTADLGILSGGVTLFEAAHLGLPAIVISQNAAQLRNLGPFESRGGIVNLGLAANAPYNNVKSAIREVGTETRLAAMSAAQEGYVDGKGLGRIVSAIKSMVGR